MPVKRCGQIHLSTKIVPIGKAYCLHLAHTKHRSKIIPQAPPKPNKASPPPPKPTPAKKSAPRFHLIGQSIYLPISIEKKNEDLEALLADDQDPEKGEEQEASETVKAMTLASMILKLNPFQPEEGHKALHLAFIFRCADARTRSIDQANSSKADTRFCLTLKG